MSRHATFENFGMAFLTLFQVSTGDNWNGIMKVHVRGLGRENRAEGRVLRVSAPEPSACPVPGRTQKGGAGNRDAEGPARGPRGKGGGGEASVGSPSAPKCCSRASAQILGDRTPPRARGSRCCASRCQALGCWPHCPSPSPDARALALGVLGRGWGSQDRDETCAQHPRASPMPPRPRPVQDTLRDCTHDERSCLSSLQFVSPLYFVSFVLTAQFVLINVVVAVLMKHLDDSNKEAQEDAEMDAELELEMAHSLGPSPRPPASSPGAPVPGQGPGGAGGGGDSEGRLCRRCYSPAQVGGAGEGTGGVCGGRCQARRARGAGASAVSGPTQLSSVEGATL